jgi:cation diffusion facilitator CzcD-associated flavoprotein CzcO
MANTQPTDIPAHSYQLSFESNLAWTQFYSGAPEILKYWQRVVDKYDIRKYMKFKHKGVEATWDERTSKWNVKIQQLDTGNIIEDTADVFMTGIGALNEWKWPDVKGLKDFQGALLHSANWDENIDVTVCSPFPPIAPG